MNPWVAGVPAVLALVAVLCRMYVDIAKARAVLKVRTRMLAKNTKKVEKMWRREARRLERRVERLERR